MFGVISLPVIKALSVYRSRQTIQIPAVCPSSIAGGICNIIQIQYFALLQIKTSGLSVTRDVVIPIVVGLIPFRALNMNEAGNYSFQACTVDKGQSKEINDGEGGESFESNLDTYKPVYPYYDMFPLAKPSTNS